MINPVDHRKRFKLAESVRSEYVLDVKGKVIRRAEGTENKKLKTGKIEIQCEQLTIFNEAKTPPFPIENEMDITDETRIKYRYLDLRRPVMYETLNLRHKT